MTRKRILIVDDEADFAALVKLNLETTGAYEVRVETNAAGAVASAREFRPDLMILDVFMPGDNGCALAGQINSALAAKVIPAIFVSANFPRQAAGSPPRQMMQYPLLAKPVTTKRLIACIESCLTQTRRNKV